MEISAICHDNGRVVTIADRAADFMRQPIVTCNERMCGSLSMLESVAATELRILIAGEPGCNKQDYAEYIHRLSARADKPYLRFDCAATHESRYEERLFGAVMAGGWVRPGVLEEACGGTVLLDGVSTVPEAFCEKLERMLESGTIVRRGGGERTAVDVRILATCAEDLMSLVHRSRRLAVLLQQLSMVRVDVLPLRQRKEDVALLTLHYLQEACERYGTRKRMGSALFREILAYSWPGNIRELKNAAEYFVTLGELPETVAAAKPAAEGFADPGERSVTQSPEELVLAIIAANTAESSGIGRVSIQHELEKQGLYLSDDKLRKLLKCLESEGKITTGRGRTGCRIV